MKNHDKEIRLLKCVDKNMVKCDNKNVMIRCYVILLSVSEKMVRINDQMVC